MNASMVALSGRGRPSGGIVPPRSLRATFSMIGGVARDVRQIDARQHQLAALQPFVVAADAVLVDERTGAAAACAGAAWAVAASRSIDGAVPVQTIAATASDAKTGEGVRA